VTCFEFVPEQLEEMFDALACFFLGYFGTSVSILRFRATVTCPNSEHEGSVERGRRQHLCDVQSM
jgi:hypothetical protein